MRLLHAGADLLRHCNARGSSRRRIELCDRGYLRPGRGGVDASGNPRAHERKHLPLRRVSWNHRGGRKRLARKRRTPRGARVNPFGYERTGQEETALQAIAEDSGAKFLAGGTNLIDLMKNGVEKPPMLIDINHLPLRAIEDLPGGGLRIGALARNSDTTSHPLVRTNYPLLARAILSGASPQLRNMATNGGNLLQRTRCYYFYDPAYEHCNKRKTGSGCAAIEGFNRIHAILGASSACIATHPSDMCVALAALGARINVRGARGERTIAFAEFHRLP